MADLHRYTVPKIYLQCHKGGEIVRYEDSGDAEGNHECDADEEDQLAPEVVCDGAEYQHAGNDPADAEGEEEGGSAGVLAHPVVVGHGRAHHLSGNGRNEPR